MPPDAEPVIAAKTVTTSHRLTIHLRDKGAMQSGIFWGYISLIEGLVARFKAEYGAPMTVIGTGGVASLFAGATAAIDRFDHDLTIMGLLEIFRRNSRSSGR